MSARVVVVGGGLAGIAAALACAEAGAAVTLVEVRPRLGGAAYSFARDGLWLDNGQHVFLRCCTAYRRLLERLGSAGDTHLQARLDIPVLSPGGRRARLRRRRLPAPLHLAGALAGYRLLTPRERLAAARAGLALRRLPVSGDGLDDRSLGAWLREHGQTEHAQAALWDLIVRPALNVPADEASLALGAFVLRTGLLERADAGDIGWAGVPLSALHDAPARRALSAAGVDVRLGWRARRVEAAGGAVRGVLGPDGVLPAAAVVLAVPAERAGGLLPEGALPRGVDLPALGTSPIVNLHVVYDRPVLDVPFAAGVGTPVQYVFDRTASSGLAHGQLLAVSLSAAEEELRLDRDALRERFLPALGDLLPRARAARVQGFHVTREWAATFRAGPGSARHRPGPRTGVRGLALAGAWTATGWPATMEGAVRSGTAAAALALDVAGRHAPADPVQPRREELVP